MRAQVNPFSKLPAEYVPLWFWLKTVILSTAFAGAKAKNDERKNNSDENDFLGGRR